MRAAVIYVVLALSAVVPSGCAVHDGWNPNYQTDGESRYDAYRRAREVALVSGEAPPRRVPVARPFDAPTPDQIAGPTLMQIIARDYRLGRAEPEPVVATAPAAPDAPALPRSASGPYAGSTPALVRYAFAARHAPGTRVFARGGGTAAEAARACARYPNAERAQLAFLAYGGPDTDPRGMDPDGDGFVCGWDPAPYRVDRL